MKGNRAAPGAMRRRRLMEQLELLCASGAGLEAIAGPACLAVRELIGADACSLFWTDAHGAPGGLYHETAPAELRDLFIDRFEELFSGPGQENFMTVLARTGPLVGTTLGDAYLERLWSGNVYKHLCVPLGHRYLIDVRVEVDGVGRSLLIAWNREGSPFTEREVELLQPVQALLQSAAIEAAADTRWIALDSGSAHFIASADGLAISAMDDEAHGLLTTSDLMSQKLAILDGARKAPAFVRGLAEQVQVAGSGHASVPVANGRLAFDARPTQRFDHGQAAHTELFVRVRHEIAAEVRCIDLLAESDLTFLQRRIALSGMLGRDRADSIARFGISTEAFKKHCNRVFRELEIDRWADLALLLRAGS